MKSQLPQFSIGEKLFTLIRGGKVHEVRVVGVEFGLSQVERPDDYPPSDQVRRTCDYRVVITGKKPKRGESDGRFSVQEKDLFISKEALVEHLMS